MASDDKPKRRIRWLFFILLLLVGMLAVSSVLLFFRPPKAERFRRRGALLLQRGQGTAAVTEFRRAIELDPKHIDAREGLVRALAVKHEYGLAFAELAEAEKAGMDKATAAFLRAGVLQSRAGFRMASAGGSAGVALCDDVLDQEINPALKVAAEHLERLKNKVEGYSFLGGAFSVKGRILEDKRRHLSREIEIARTGKQQALLESKQLIARDAMVELLGVIRQATAAYEKVLELETANLTARLSLAAFALRGHVAQPRRALLLLEPALKEHPDNPTVIKRMAEAQHIAGDNEAALALVRRLPAEQRSSESVLFEAEVLIALERWQEADIVLRKITDVLGTMPERIKLTAAYLHGKVLRQLKQPDKAANFLQNIFSNPGQTWVEARYELALALREAGLREQSIAALNQVEKDARVARVRNVRERQRVREAVYATRMDLAREWRSESPRRAGEYAGSAFFLYPDRKEALELARECYGQVEDGRKIIDDLVLHHVAWLGGGKNMDAAVEACGRELKMPNAPERRLRRALARLHVRHGSYAKAAEEYQALWQDHPDDLAAGLELGRLRIQLGDHDEALAVYRKLRETFPGDFAVISGTVSALLAGGDVDGAWEFLKPYSTRPETRGAREVLLKVFLRHGRTGDAIKLAQWQASAQPDSRSHAMLGELLLRDGRLDEGREAFGRALQLDPTNQAAYTLGLLELADGKHDAGVRVFRDATTRFPNWFAGNLYLGLALLADGRPVEAENVVANILRTAPAGAPQWDLPRLLLAFVLIELGETERALAANREVVSIEFGLPEEREQFLSLIARREPGQRSEIASDSAALLAFRHAALYVQARRQGEELGKALPNALLPQYWVAQTLANAERFDEAIALCRGIIEAHPGSIFARTMMADFCEQASDRIAAIKIREEALELSSGVLAAHIRGQLAKSYEEEGQIDVAIENYRNAIEAGPVNVFALNNIAWLLATRRGDAKGALDYIERAVLADKRHAPPPAVLDTMGWVYYLNGDYEKAVKVLERAKSILGRSPNVRYHLGMTYLKVGRASEAKAELQEALGLSDDFEFADEARKALESL